MLSFSAEMTVVLVAIFAAGGAHAKVDSNNQKSQSHGQSVTSDPSVFTSNLQSKTQHPLPISTPSLDTFDFESIIDQIGSTCANNTDCDGSTFCCSKGRCVPGSICYKGQKQALDHCDYGFECLSRCCATDVCSPVIQCVETCQRNSDCANEPCCSFGYCTGSVSICTQGMKEDFDMCEVSTECLTGRCTNGRCTSNEIEVSSQVSLNLMIILVFLMLIIVVMTCYFAKIKTDQAESMNNYRRPRARDSSQETDGQERTMRRRNRRGSDRGMRSGSNSSERRQRRSGSGNEDSSGRDLFQSRERQGGRVRGLSDSNRQPSVEALNKENLERLSRQANSVKQTPSNKDASRGHMPPALLFVEDEQEILNQFGSSFVTTNRGSEHMVRVASDKENLEHALSQELTQAGSGITIDGRRLAD